MSTNVRTCLEDGQPLNRSSSQPQRTGHGHCFAQADILALHQQQPPICLGKRGSHECNTRFLLYPFLAFEIVSTRARFASSTHCFLEGTRAVGEIKISELFVPIQSMSPGRNFYPAKILCYTVCICLS